MKMRKRVIAAIGVCATGLIAVQAVSAVEVQSQPTEGSIKFIKGTSDGRTTVPDEQGKPPEEIIIPSGDGQETTTGELRIQFVPNFKFGSHEGITAAKAEQNIELMSYQVGSGSPSTPIAPFVQVGDYRGEVDGKWRLTVTADKFKAAGADDLENVTIKLSESTLTMDYHTSAEAATYVKGQGAGDVVITAGNVLTPTPILETLATGKTTSGYAVSNVFQKEYKKGEVLTGNKGKTGIKFIKAAGQAPQTDVTYTSILTWSLTNAL